MTTVHPERVPEYLQHIIEAIDRAIGYVAGMNATVVQQDTRMSTGIQMSPVSGSESSSPGQLMASGSSARTSPALSLSLSR